jgi:Domain of unknown function (DUF4276)
VVKLFVEGGGETHALKTRCREGFSSFLEKAGISKKPRIVACGSRKNAFDSYCTALENGESAFLLVDAESPVDPKFQSGKDDTWLPWSHLNGRTGDKWGKPAGARDLDCHLMTQLMETWFMADRSALAKYFGSDFNESKLPAPDKQIETIDKSEVYSTLKEATKPCSAKGEYGKGRHSFDLLKLIDAKKVIGASPWANRFITALS